MALLCFPLLSNAQQVRKINVLNADEARFDRSSGITARRLIGNVVFKHEDAMMYCDSAWFFPSANTMDAYGSVRIEQGDSVNMTGKFMSYNGKTRMAKMRDSVVLIHKGSRLITDSLNFDRQKNIGYYFDFGEIDHEDIDLSSYYGYYYPDTKDYFAVDSVRLIHPDYTIFADTLKYNTESKITDFLGPTHIISDSSRIKCEIGWYDTENDISAFGENTILYQQSQTIWADSLFYDRNIRYGKAWRNIYMLDTVEQFAGSGNYAEYDELTGKSFITDSALVMYYDNLDTTYIHADTVFMQEVGDSARRISAYYKVQIFKEDMQGRCDSLVYFDSDSVSVMYGNPILWSGESQITADTIEMKMRNGVAEQLNMKNSAFIVMQEDSIRYSQISGRDMIAWIRDNELHKIDVLSNAETIYYGRDDKTDEIIGVNKEVSNSMTIYRKDGQVRRIDFIGSPDGVFMPEKDTDPLEMRLRNFVWYGKYRPIILADIFIWHEIKALVKSE
ncbi:MAG: OstA-like protein [Bacteroidota bacterium]|nr:OstA-like protein [Bacteroidota bacterium]